MGFGCEFRLCVAGRVVLVDSDLAAATENDRNRAAKHLLFVSYKPTRAVALGAAPRVGVNWSRNWRATVWGRHEPLDTMAARNTTALLHHLASADWRVNGTGNWSQRNRQFIDVSAPNHQLCVHNLNERG